MVKKGVFVCVEGLDGCGKTTQAKRLVRALRRKGYDAVYTAEPSKGRIGTFIKRYCLHGGKRLSNTTEALLFAADRFEHVENEILPALNRGKFVVSDRYVYSSLAYQGAAGLELEWIRSVNGHAIKPDLAVFIDVEPTVAVGRLKPRKSVMENLETQRKVREVYMGFVASRELMKIDGQGSEEEVAADVLEAAMSFLGKSP